mmetsp:Transcript_125641/g.177305  ORF Transcript_125641/g.177305 Transcript_125641/m.177305 type:complete len:201 (-) Transcript_125641:51-653(-)
MCGLLVCLSMSTLQTFKTLSQTSTSNLSLHVGSCGLAGISSTTYSGYGKGTVLGPESFQGPTTTSCVLDFVGYSLEILSTTSKYSSSGIQSVLELDNISPSPSLTPNFTRCGVGSGDLADISLTSCAKNNSFIAALMLPFVLSSASSASSCVNPPWLTIFSTDFKLTRIEDSSSCGTWIIERGSTISMSITLGVICACAS